MQATDTIPIVMTLAPDPVGSGFVNNLARPGGNVTGMSALAPDLAGKRVELLKEIVPRAVRGRCCGIRASKRRSPSGRTRRNRRAASG